MSIEPAQCGGLILAGGASRRMGRCKALLPHWEEGTMLEHLTRELSSLSQVILSANRPDLGKNFPGLVVKDRYEDCGPLGGLHAALSVAEREYLLCVPCDMPGFSHTMIAPLLEGFPPGGQALVCVDGSGRVHPLCGIYARSALPAIEAQLATGRRSVGALLDRLDCRFFNTASLWPDQVYTNVNTPEEYCSWLESREA